MNVATIGDHLFTARKQSLGQGNIFRSVCQEFYPQGGGMPQCMRGYHPRVQHAGRYGQQASGTHPTGMQSCS